MHALNRSPGSSGNKYVSPIEGQYVRTNSPGSFFSPSSQGSSSKAVLAALRALQDKIRRLEAEKIRAEDETKNLRTQIQRKELEFDYQKQKEKTISQRNLNETRSAYESALFDKTQLESRVNELEEKNQDLRTNTEELVESIRRLEDDKYHKEMTLKDVESKLLHLEMQIEVSQQRERDLAHTIAAETKQFEERRQALSSQLQQAKRELEEVQRDQHDHDRRVHELDELTRQLLHLNDTLVTKLSQSSQSNTSLRKILGIAKKYPVPTTMTESARARHRSPVRTQAELTAKEQELFGDEEIENLKALHTMYRGLAKSLTQTQTEAYLPLSSSSPASTKKRSKAIRHQSSSSMPTKHSPMSVYKSSHSRESDQESDSMNEEHSEDPADSALALAEDLRAATLDRTNKDFLSMSYLGRTNSHHHLVSKSSGRASLSSSAAFRSLESTSKTSSTIDGTNKSSTDVSKKIFEKVIQSLEEEFESLTTQYKSLLSAMQRESEQVKTGTSSEASTRHSEQLIFLIQQLQRKGDQLRALKS